MHDGLGSPLFAKATEDELVVGLPPLALGLPRTSGAPSFAKATESEWGRRVESWADEGIP